MKKILIALDYDPGAEKVAETGYSLAKGLGAEVILIHVLADTLYYMPLEYSPVMGFSGIPEAGLIQPLDVEQLKEAATLFLESCRSHLGDSNITIIISEGDFADSILSTAVRLNASLIVTGSHRRSGLEKILTGSVIEKLLHDSDIPLFIIPTKSTNVNA